MGIILYGKLDVKWKIVAGRQSIVVSWLKDGVKMGVGVTKTRESVKKFEKICEKLRKEVCFWVKKSESARPLLKSQGSRHSRVNSGHEELISR